ncbi:MAG: DUF2911 domain-containing protein [Candidatus Hydrogenedentes bacterium]|nr:DUF2911 domain-containing protein [Candidatus Hydrogenedentota bacterium]
MMRRVVVLVGVVALALTSLNADAQRKKTKPDVSQGASVTQTIGVDTQITIAYHRPGVKGRDVWTEKSDNVNIGPLVPRDGDPRPWRSGANEATTIEVSGDVLVEGKELPAGKYALFMIPTDGDWTVVFSKQAQQWGAFGYKQKDDALRVTVTPVEAPHQEWLAYGFDDPGTWSATAYLRWNDVKIPFKIEVEEQE